MTEWLHFHFSLSCTGEGNGNPLQCSCLENPRDRGAWWAAVYRVTHHWTRLRWLSSSAVVNHIFLNKINCACLWALENVILLYNLLFSLNVSFVKFTHVVYYSLNLLKLWSKDLCWHKTLPFQDKYRNRAKCLETAIAAILASFIMMV